MDPLRRLERSGIWLGSLLLLLSGLSLWDSFRIREDIWWTPKELALPLDQTTNSFRLTVRGQPLEHLLAEGRLRLDMGDGSRAVAATDVRARLNNVDRIKAARAPIAAAAGAVLGGSVVLLLAAAFGLKAVVRAQRAPES
jgi:hypothetical protein